MEMERKNVKSLIKEMELDYPLLTAGDYRKVKPEAYEHGIYQYNPNQFWGLWTNNKPFWCKHKKDNPNGIGIYEALEDIWEIMSEEIEGDEITYSINKVLIKGGRRNGELFCKYTPKYLEESLKKDNGLFEIIYKQPTKLFVDIDVKCSGKDPNSNLEGYYREAIKAVKQ
jgi:hypothetical protein